MTILSISSPYYILIVLVDNQGLVNVMEVYRSYAPLSYILIASLVSDKQQNHLIWWLFVELGASPNHE